MSYRLTVVIPYLKQCSLTAIFSFGNKPLGTRIKIQQFSYKKIIFDNVVYKKRPLYLGRNVLKVMTQPASTEGIMKVPANRLAPSDRSGVILGGFMEFISAQPVDPSDIDAIGKNIYPFMLHHLW